MTHRFGLIVFDFDGTLVDSQASITRCMAQAFEEAGLSGPPAAAVRRVVGLSLEIAIARLLPEGAADLTAQVCDSYRRAFFAWRAHPEFHEPLFPGVRETLAVLNAPRVQLGIATGKNLRGLRFSLEHHGLASLFTTLQTPDTSPSKPHPGMLERAMVESGCSREETVFIGDTSFDMEMARNAGVTGIGVAWGYHEHDELTEAGAACVVESFAELETALTERDGLPREIGHQWRAGRE